MDIAFYPGIVAYVLPKFIGEPGHLLGIPQQLPAFVRENEGVVDALKEQAAQFRFQLLDLERHRGLGIIQHPGGFGKTVQLCHLDECA